MADGRIQIRQRTGLRLWLSALWLGVLVLAAVLAPWMSPQDPLAQDLFLGRLPPFWGGSLSRSSRPRHQATWMHR